MKRLLIPAFVLVSVIFLGGCCTDQLSCGTGASYVSTNNCCNTCATKTCASTCNTCGYDATYTYSAWY